MQRSPSPFIHHIKTWFIRGGWIVVLIVGYYLFGYGLFVSGALPGSYSVAFYFHWIFAPLFWIVALTILPISTLLLLLKAIFPRRLKWKIVGGCIGYMVASLLLFFPIGGYAFEKGPSLEVRDWGRSYHVSLFVFDDEGLLNLYECGPLQLLCHSIYHECNNFGSQFQERMSLRWSDHTLSFYNQNTLYYQRTKDAVLFRLLEEHEIKSRCLYSFWTP